MRHGFLNKTCYFMILFMVILGAEIPSLNDTFENTEQSYLHYDLEIQLTADEKEWLEAHKRIRVSGPSNFPPFHFFDEEERARGIASDYIRVLFDNLGIEMVPQVSLPWPEVLDRARNKQLDVLSCSAKSRDREEYLLFTSPHLSFPLVIISRDDSPFIGGLKDLEGLHVALVNKNITSDWLKRDQIAVNPVITGTPLEALEAVSIGEADAYIGNLASCSYLIRKNGLANLKVAAPTDYGYYNLYIAVRHDWPELVSILNKGLQAISAKEHSEIHNEWLSIKYEYGIRPADILKAVLIAVGISGIVVLFILLWNRRLSKEIETRKRTEKELTEALTNIETLTGLLPICAKCKNIRDDKGYWNQIEEYFEKHSELTFSHSLCPGCFKKLYGEEEWFDDEKKS